MVKIITSYTELEFNKKLEIEVNNGLVPFGSLQVTPLESTRHSGNLGIVSVNNALQYTIMMTKNQTELNVLEINTTAYSDENFVLVTSLTDEQLEAVIVPIVLRERTDGTEYNNEELAEALRITYPDAIVQAIYNLKVIEI